MRDRADFWAPVPDWPTALLEGEGIRIAPVRGIVGIHVASGRVDLALERLGGLQASGPRDRVRGERYALRLAPDRVLVVSSRAEPLAPGWSAEGFATSDVTEGMIALDIVGDAAFDIIAEGTGYDLSSKEPRPRESANLLLAGLRVALASRTDGLRLHVERPIATALWSWLTAAVRDLGAG